MNEKLEKRIDILVKLGEILRSDSSVEEVIAKASSYNPWFTPGFCRSALDALIGKMLDRDKLTQWLSRYDIKGEETEAKTIGIIMAGNLPLVGFHDFLCAYIPGHNVKIKLSGKDDILFPYIYERLSEIDLSLKSKVSVIDRLEGFDAVIATGSNNTNRYFEYYFRKYPKILRKNRNSIAILTGQETGIELLGLADDIFMYFGFGCRNVSKLYVPEEYDLTRLFPYFDKYKWMHDHTKYMNNYDYNRTLLLMNRTEHLANDFIMIQESTAISSPISILHYERYNVKSLEQKLINNLNDIQCVVSKPSIIVADNQIDVVKFGYTQCPELWEYADNVDTLSFCSSLNPGTIG
jgi:hypothetical protein